MTYSNDRQANLAENVIFTLTNFSFAVLSDPFRSEDLCTVGDLNTAQKPHQNIFLKLNY